MNFCGEAQEPEVICSKDLMIFLKEKIIFLGVFSDELLVFSAKRLPSVAGRSARARFLLREATKPFGTNRAAKTERNINNYRNAPLAIFRNSSMPVCFPLVAPRGSKNHLNDFCPRRSRIRIIMYISFRKNLEDGLSEMFCCQRENAVLVGYGHGFCLQACLQGKGRDEGYGRQNRIIVE